MKKNICFFLVSCMVFLISCKSDRPPLSETVKGNLDLRNWDFNRYGSLDLEGEWIFLPENFNSSLNTKTSFIEVPGEWRRNKNYGIYKLTIQLPENHPLLGLKVTGVSSSYILELNSKTIDSVGIAFPDSEKSIPAYERNIYPISSKDTTLQIILKVANFEHYKGGILNAPVIGAYEKMTMENKAYSFTGGVLIGICLISAILYFVLFLYMREAKYFLIYSLFLLIVAIHFSCLIERMMYVFFVNLSGTSGWYIAYKIELFTLFLGFTIKFVFYDSLFKNILSNKLVAAFCIILMLQALFVLIAPAPLFTYIDLFIPYNVVAIFTVLIFLFIKAHNRNLEGSTTIVVLNVFLLAVVANENFIFNKNVHDLQLIHFAIIFHVIGISVVLIRKIIHAFRNEKKLAVELYSMNEKYERQNRNLEEIVGRRTTQLIEAEKKSHELQMEKRTRDMDLLSANNLMKLQFTRNLIQELEELSKNEKELKTSLHTLVKKLKVQESIEEKLDILQNDLDRINAEFYERLNTRFPDLSKTERELCAYIKLNLSNKDIAELRKTSLNTINVSRSRLRKKLGLPRDEELEMFIQQF